MVREGHGSALRASAQVDVVILSGACCNPAAGALDARARQVVDQAIAETGVNARVSVKPMSSALYGGVPAGVVAQMRQDAESGGLRVPVVIVNGRGVSFGVPNREGISAALRALATETPGKGASR